MIRPLLSVLVAFVCARVHGADDFARLCEDRRAVERIYYNHRLGEKPPFDQITPRALIEKLVRQDLRKESVLQKVYSAEITPVQIEAEAQRINTTSRAPEILAELKAALSNDPVRFARTIVKPILVERELRSRFENDDRLHAAQRKQAGQLRAELLAARPAASGADPLVAFMQRKQTGTVNETTWQLDERPADPAATDDAGIKKRFGPQAQLLSAPDAVRDRKFYFADLPTELQRVLRVQLNRAGDISAVIEMPDGFRVYVLEDRTTNTLRAAAMTIPKRSYEEWLNQSEKEIP